MPDDQITEIDRMAYIDGQLDDPRRLDVETSLSNDPPAAAEMMGDLAQRTALRMAMARLPAAASPELATLAGSARRPRPWRTRRFAAVAAALVTAMLLGVADDAWRVKAQIPGEPDYLDDAVQSREASLIRTAMASRPRTPWMRPNDIRTAIRIRLPVLPANWRLLDVQVYPSDGGPSAQLLIDTGGGRQISLFSSRIEGDRALEPVVVDRQGETMAFWEVDGQSFVLIGDLSRTTMRDMALDLSDNRLL